MLLAAYNNMNGKTLLLMKLQFVHRTWSNRVGTDWKAFFLLASFHNTGRHCVGCWGSGVGSHQLSYSVVNPMSYHNDLCSTTPMSKDQVTLGKRKEKDCKSPKTRESSTRYCRLYTAEELHPR